MLVIETTQSTSGVFLCLVGPCSFIPLAGISKKQTSVSKSTPEAEIVALDHGVSKEGIPALALWTKILGRSMQIRVMEDNDAASRIIITGRNPSMRYMSRTQRIDVAWLNERFSGGDFGFVTCPSEFQAADIMTKSFTDVVVWKRNLMLIGHFESGKWMRDDDNGFSKKPSKVEEAEITKDCAVLAAATSVEAHARSSHDRINDACLRLQRVSARSCLPDVYEHRGKIKECFSSPGILRRIDEIRSHSIPVHLMKYVNQGELPYQRTIVEFCCD